jgi:hypothetical protein
MAIAAFHPIAQMTTRLNGIEVRLAPTQTIQLVSLIISPRSEPAFSVIKNTVDSGTETLLFHAGDATSINDDDSTTGLVSSNW